MEVDHNGVIETLFGHLHITRLDERGHMSSLILVVLHLHPPHSGLSQDDT